MNQPSNPILRGRIRPLALLCLLALWTVGCAGTSKRPTGPDVLQPTQTGKTMMQGTVTINSVALGTQTADFTLIYAEMYGTRIEVLGPAGTPLLFASINPRSFEVYSVPERALIRDKIGNIVNRLDRSTLTLLTAIMGAISSYASNFGEMAIFQNPEPTAYGLLYKGRGPTADMEVRWYDRAAGAQALQATRSLQQIVVDTGFTFVYADRTKGDTFHVHFGDQIPLVSIDINKIDTNFKLQGIQWQLLIPPGSEVFTYAQYLSSRR